MREDYLQISTARLASGGPTRLRFSLLRLSAGTRLFGASIVIGGLWGAVFWALR